MTERKNTDMLARRGEGRPATGVRQESRPQVPPVDIYEDQEGIVVLADMPGVTKEGLDVQVDKNVLTIRGAIDDQVSQGVKPLYAEFGSRSYQRVFTLGPDVDVGRIKANMSAGVLKLVLPKAEAVKPRRIEVRAV